MHTLSEEAFFSPLALRVGPSRLFEPVDVNRSCAKSSTNPGPRKSEFGPKAGERRGAHAFRGGSGGIAGGGWGDRPSRGHAGKSHHSTYDGKVIIQLMTGVRCQVSMAHI